MHQNPQTMGETILSNTNQLIIKNNKQVSMPRNKIVTNIFLQRFMQTHPYLFQFLQRFLKLVGQ